MIPALARAAMLLRGLLNRRGSAVADGSRRGCLLSGCLLTAGCLGAGALVAVACCGAVIAALAGAGASASDVCASLCSITPIDCIDVHASQGFGNTPWEHPHTGIDIVCPAGTPVISVTGGVFHRRSGGSIACLFPKGARGGLGTFAEVDTDGVSFLYGHLATLVPADGSTVVPGAQLGTEGSTGCSSGAHLHFEVRVQGMPVNPCGWLPAAYPAAHDAWGRCWGAVPP